MEAGELPDAATPNRAVAASKWKTAVAAAAAQSDLLRAPSSTESFRGDRRLNVPSIIEDRRHSAVPAAQPAVPKLAVMVHRVIGLPGGDPADSSRGASPAELSTSAGRSSSSSRQPPLYVTASVHQPGYPPLPHNKQRTHATRKQGGAAAWRSLLTLSPAHPGQQVLTISLKHKLPLLNKTVVWGSATLPLSRVLEQPGLWGERTALRLTGHRVSGQQCEVEVQLFLSAERLRGPLSVLCATWNVGNAAPPPPEQLAAWLPVSGAQHHLVAVGAQECNYSKDARRSASAKRASQGGGLAVSNSMALPAAGSPVAGAAGNPQPPGQAAVSSAGNCCSALAAPTPAAPSPASAAAAAAGAAAAASPDPDDAAAAASVPGTSRATCGSEPATDAPGSISDIAVSDSDYGVGRSRPALSSTGGPESTAGGAADAADAGGGPQPSGESRAAKERLKGLWAQVDSAAAWERHVTAALGPKYVLMEAKHMFQTRLLVFARIDVVPAISSIDSGFEATGIGRIGMNKGGVGISLRLDDTHLAFISSHLAAHQSKVAQRNADVAEISANLHLAGAAAKGADLTTAFHHLFWMGDLNYRLAYGQQATTQADSPTPEDFAALCADVAAGRFQELLQLDQLRREQAAGRVFAGFSEGNISFAPTFKVDKGDPGLCYAPKRSPAWCDRVLAKSALPHKAAAVVDYFTVPAISSSDHKPVAAVLSVPLATETVTGGHAAGRTPFKLYISSLKLLDESGWRQLAALLEAQQIKRPRLQLVVSGACMAGPRHEHVMKLNVDAACAAMAAAKAAGSSPGDGDCSSSSSSSSSSANGAFKASLLLHEENMPLLPGAVHSLSDDWLLLRLVVVEGFSQRVLARAVVPLQPAVAEYTARTFKPAPVTVQLERNAASLGRLSVQLQLISSLSARQGMYEAIRRMRMLAMARSHSLNAAPAHDAPSGQQRVVSAHGRSSSGTKVADWLLGRVSRWPWPAA